MMELLCMQPVSGVRADWAWTVGPEYRLIYITCRDVKSGWCLFGKTASQAMSISTWAGAPGTVKGQGIPMAVLVAGHEQAGILEDNQILWEKAGIQADITPYAPRHSFAAHLTRGSWCPCGPGHAWTFGFYTTAQMYAAYSGIRWGRITGRPCREVMAGMYDIDGKLEDSFGGPFLCLLNYCAVKLSCLVKLVYDAEVQIVIFLLKSIVMPVKWRMSTKLYPAPWLLYISEGNSDISVEMYADGRRWLN